MSWVRDSELTWTQKLAVNIIKCGPMPNHIAFIMDGNRRFATKTHLSSKTEGHIKGFGKLSEALQWCLDIGIKEVTVYAFSIENFKRSEDEVNTLMTLAREKFIKLIEEKDKLMERGICIRIVGNLSMLPIDIQKLMAEAMLMTKDNSAAILNVAFAYTSRDEITESLRYIIKGVSDNELLSEDISDGLIRKCMYTRHSDDPDLLIRTSGESRLSDFMLWQVRKFFIKIFSIKFSHFVINFILLNFLKKVSTTMIYFTKILWPEFTIWHLLGGVFHYQRHINDVITSRKCLKSQSANINVRTNKRVEIFLNKFEQRQIEHLQNLLIEEPS